VNTVLYQCAHLFNPRRRECATVAGMNIMQRLRERSIPQAIRREWLAICAEHYGPYTAWDCENALHLHRLCYTFTPAKIRVLYARAVREGVIVERTALFELA